MEFINKLNAMDDENNPILFIYELEFVFLK